jgi:hypothetical protein
VICALAPAARTLDGSHPIYNKASGTSGLAPLRRHIEIRVAHLKHYVIGWA